LGIDLKELIELRVGSRALREVKLTLNRELQLQKKNVFLKAFFLHFFAEL